MSPNAASLAQYIDVPISYYSGIPEISIPIYEIEEDGVKVPISLSYHAGGIKVPQEASWVGLGWTLNVGGSISRTIRCTDDFNEDYDGYISKGFYDSPDIDDYAPMWIKVPCQEGSGFSLGILTLGNFKGTKDDCAILNQKYFYKTGFNDLDFRLKYDSEPDIFYYSLPGYSGKFVLDKSRGAVLADKSHNLKITVNRGDGGGIFRVNFTIETPNGTKYEFTKSESTKTYTVLGWRELNLPTTTVLDDELDDSEDKTSFASTWLLTSITTPKNKVINFIYEQEQYKSPVQESLSYYNHIPGYFSGSCMSDGMVHHSGSFSSSSKTYNETYRLKEIKWDNGSVVFTASSRLDMIGSSATYNPKKLDEVAVYDKNNGFIKGFKFNYNYINKDYAGSYPYIFKRLKLTKLVEVQSDSSKYLNNGYCFSYFSGEMPAKNSKNTDYWGYSNGQKYGAKYYDACYYDGKEYDGAIKRGNLTFLKIGTLSSIKYPTGEDAVFTYEENEYQPLDFDASIPEKEYKYQRAQVFNKYQKDGDYTDDNEVCKNSPKSTSDTIVIDRTCKMSFSVDMHNLYERNEIDPTFTYHDNSSPIGRLKRITSRQEYIVEFAMPYFTDDGDGDDSEYRYQSDKLTLQPGTYVFDAYTPPRDVCILWNITYEFKKIYSTPAKGAGLRIAQIKTGNKIRRFNYFGGQLLIRPIISTGHTDYCVSGVGSEQYNFFVQLSEPACPLITQGNGCAIGYDRVQEVISDGKDISMTEYQYHNEPEVPLIESFPFSTTVPDYYNGLPNEIDYYQNNILVKQTQFTYDREFSPRINSFICFPTTRPYIYYQHNFQFERVLKKNESSWTFTGDSEHFVEEDKTYTYNNNDLPSSETTSIDGNSYENKTRYSTDFTDDISKAMVAKNMVGIPVETVNLKNDKVTAAI
jgi:hypothetical protein